MLPAAALALSLFTFPSAAGASIAEFTGLTAGEPVGITAGPDGAVWFTEQGSPGAIGRITTAGAITEYRAGDVPGFTADSEPADIVTGPDGALWFTEQGVTDAIGRFDPATETVTEYTLGLTPDADPAGIAVGPDGNLWFAERAKGAIGRITPAGVITEYTSGISGGSEPTDIAAGPDGKLWFTESADPGRIGRIDPATGSVTEFSTGLTPNGAPSSIVAASSGKLFFTQTAGSSIGRVKTDGRIDEYSTGLTVGAQPAGIAEGGDGALWFTASAAPGRLGRLWPDSGAIQELTGGLTAGLSGDSDPAGITRGPDGNVWFTQRALPGIGRVTVPPRAAIDTPKPADTGKILLRASVRPNSQATTYFFEYGPTSAYTTQTETLSAGAGAEPVWVETAVDLARDAHYHVRVTAVNASGTAVSEDKPFYVTAAGEIVKEKPTEEGTSTVDVAPPAPQPEGGQQVGTLPPAAPVLGQSVTVKPRRGKVRIKPRGASRFLPLEAGASIPVGSLVDARRGRVVLRTAVAGGSQKGTFWGAIFQIRQRRGGRGMTDLVLRGGRFSRCSAKLASIAAVPRRDAGRRRVVRRLWGRDRHGRFRTHGRDSVATVRGTVWSTVDRCDGTVTRVKQGKVLVRDLRRKRSVLVRAGGAYFARHRR